MKTPNDKDRFITSIIKTNEKKTRTYLSEQENVLSYYDTINECVEYDIPLEVDETKSPKNPDIRYLQMMKVMQDKYFLNAEKKQLAQHEKELKDKENYLLQF